MYSGCNAGGLIGYSCGRTEQQVKKVACGCGDDSCGSELVNTAAYGYSSTTSNKMETSSCRCEISSRLYAYFGQELAKLKLHSIMICLIHKIYL